MADHSLIYRAHNLAPELPWNNWKPDDLGSVVMQFMEDQEPFYARWAEVWYQNFQFIYGNQTARWSRRYGYAVDSDFLRREPTMNQRAQTNISRVVAEALASLIYSNLPTWVVDAASESSVKGKRFKRLTEKILDAYMVRLCMDKEFSAAALIFTTFGQVGAWTDWKKQAGKLLEIPKWKKSKAPVFTDYMAPNPFTGGSLEIPTQALNMDGSPRNEERWEAVLDEMGRQVVEKMFAGDAGVTMLTPFEYRREMGSYASHRSRYIERLRLMDYDEYLDEYKDVAGQTKYFNSIKPVYNNPAIYRIAVRHFMRMQYTTPPSLGDLYQRPNSSFKNATFKNKVMVVEHWDKPHSEKWPKGRRLVIVNGDCTHVTEPDYTTNKADGWNPLSEAQWLAIAPSSIATGPLNDVVAKNRELNIADSLVATSMRRNMGSVLLYKAGIGFDPQRMTGEPGKTAEVGDPFAMRYLHDEMPLPAVLPSLRQGFKDDVYESSGANDALRGERSPGASSGYALRQIQEREERRLAPARKAFGAFAASIGEKLFCCIKQNVITLDDDIMGFLTRSAAGGFQPNDVVALMSSTIDLGIEIKIEEESMALKSKATQQATLLELIQNPQVGSRLQNPKVLDSFLKYFDAEDELRDDSTTHRERAERENEVFLDLMRLGPDTDGLQLPVVLQEDDDAIHAGEHIDFLLQNSDEMIRNEVLFERFLVHLETHRIQSDEKQAKALPGTSLQVGNMTSAIKQSPTPTVQTIYQNTKAEELQQQMNPAQGNGAQTPAAPAPVGSGGPPQTSTAAPSKNTPSAASQGGKPGAAA